MNKTLMFLLLMCSTVFSMKTDTLGFKVIIIKEREISTERDTTIITHYNKNGDKFYVITKDKKEIWCDDLMEIE